MTVQLLRFLLVGGAATVLHMAVGIALLARGVHPLQANLLAFVTAFTVSFLGHFFYSFAEQNPDFIAALSKFVVVAFSGFLINESLLSMLMWLQSLDPRLALLCSTGFAAFSTFLLSRFWAFARCNSGTAEILQP